MRKDTGSNNYKHHLTTGSQLQEAKQVLSKLEWDKELTKPIEIYKVQNQPYNYTIHFKTNVPINTALFYKNSTLITPVEVETGHYTYTGTSTNIIPDDKFSCTITTTNEETWSHGIPENTETQHDIYDHDSSLDMIGDLLGIPRREFKSVSSSEYNRTVPAYNNLSMEGDYEYSQRLIEFCNDLHVKSLPVLYLKAWLGVSGELVNRESLLCKLCPGDYQGNLPEGDSPLSWEHRDQLCNGSSINDYLFNYTVNTRKPLNTTVLRFTFNFLDSLWSKHSVTGVIVPYVNGDNQDIGVITSTESWSIVSEDLSDEDYLVRFKYFSSSVEAEAELTSSSGLFVEDGLFTDEYLFTVIGGTSADLYVSTTGSDSTGTGSYENPYRTIRYGVSKAVENDTVAVITGDYSENLISTGHSINLISYNTSPVSVSSSTRDFMSIGANKSVLFDGIGFVKDTRTSVLENTNVYNECSDFSVYMVKRTHLTSYTGAVAGRAVSGDAIVGTSE